MPERAPGATDAAALAVSTVIFALRPHETDRAHDALDPVGAPHEEPAEGPVGTARRLAPRRRGAGQRRGPHARRDHGAGTHLPRAAVHLRRAGALPRPPRRLGRLLGDGAVRRGRAGRPRARTCAGSSPTNCRRSPSTTTASSTTPSGGCAPRWSTPPSRTPSSGRPSPSPNCARSTRPCCNAPSTPPTSDARSRPPAPSSRPARSSPAPGIARRGCTATTPPSTSPTADHSARSPFPGGPGSPQLPARQFPLRPFHHTGEQR